MKGGFPKPLYNRMIVMQFGEDRKSRALALMRRKGVVTPADARAAGTDADALEDLAREGVAERVGRGLYSFAPEHPFSDPSLHRSLVEACVAQPNGVVCLLSALAFHVLGT